METFIRAADAGSFSKAAEGAFITPTAVIKQINLLEASLGVKLFERTHRGLVLTSAGRSLYQDAKYILAVGGGSVSDCCKVVAAQAKLDQDIWDMETVKHTYPTDCIPLGTVMTVFGTGSEMNNGAVITNEEKKLKAGIWAAQALNGAALPSASLLGDKRTAIFG